MKWWLVAAVAMAASARAEVPPPSGELPLAEMSAGWLVSWHRFNFAEPAYPTFVGNAWGVRFDVTMTPFARWADARIPAPLAGIGVGVTVGSVFYGPGMLCAAADCFADGIQVEERQIEGGLRWRWRVGRGPELLAALEYGSHGYRVENREKRWDVNYLGPPDVWHSYLAPALGIGLPLAGWLAIDLRCHLLAVLDSGAVRKRYGAGQTWGFRPEIGLELRWREAMLRLSAFYERFEIGFDPPQPTGGAVDQFFGGAVAIGFRAR